MAAPSSVLMDQAARRAMEARDAAAAQNAVNALLQAHPAYPPAWLTASVLALDLGQPQRALQAAARGLHLSPSQPALLVQQVRCLTALGDQPGALHAARNAEARIAASPPAQYELGNAFAALGRYDDALRLIDAARASQPADPSILYNRATVLRFLGRFAEAEADLDSVIARTPADWEAYALRSGLRTQTPGHNHVAEFRSVLARGVPAWAGEVQLRYALAKELEDLGAYAASFAELSQGAAKRRQFLQYDVAEDIATIDRIIATLNRYWLARAPAGQPGAAPLFIFGLPRSGTTLVERILGSHGDLVSLGELNDFPAALMQCAAQTQALARPDKLALVALSATLDPAPLGAAYLARVRRHAPSRPRFIDKLPMNYLYAGLIAAALPDATLIHVRRHPMANGYGMYKTLFNQGYPFSYDLDDLGRYIAAYERLMAHWHGLLGSRLITVSYEALVADQEGQTRQLVASCGLAWDEACLAPHRNAAPSSTQSAVQVRRPVHGEAVDHWRHFATELAPLLHRLIAEGVPLEAVG
jgi:tetratricopeptide (TPR) repeat protein